MNGHLARSPWLLSVAVVASTLAFIGGLIFAVYQIEQNRSETKARLALDRRLIAANAERIHDNTKALGREIDQVRYSAYIFCRSEGRSPRDCKKIARLVVLPAVLNVNQLKAGLAKIGEAEITKLLVGPPGKRGRVGTKGIPGIPGVQGPRGRQGIQGIQGPRGSHGQKGARGARGPAGPQGAQGPAGPAGPAGPQGPMFNCASVGGKGPMWVTVPSRGQEFTQIYVCVK